MAAVILILGITYLVVWIMTTDKLDNKPLTKTTIMHQLGKEGKDKITGFKGIITARVQYITGCDQYSLTPPAVDGAIKSGEYFDEGRIEIIGNGILPEEIKTEKDGGPNRDAPRR